MTQEHALRLAEVFEEMYPQFPDLARVITYKSDYKGSLIDSFKKENMPRIAISVDMLETGIDVPEVVNLVLMKPVQSRIKLEQMIGRGTRSQAACMFPRSAARRAQERVPDHRLLGERLRQAARGGAGAEPAGAGGAVQHAAEAAGALSGRPDASSRSAAVVADLRAMIARIPTRSFSVKRVLSADRSRLAGCVLAVSTRDKIEFLRLKVGPLLRYAPGVDVAGATFTTRSSG